MNKRESLKYKLPAKIIGILTAIFLAVYVSATIVVRQSIIRSSIVSMNEVADLSKKSIESTLRTTLQTLDAFARIPEINSPERSLNEKMDYLLENMMDDTVVRFDIIDKNGNGFDSNGEEFNGTKQSAYKQIMNGEEYSVYGPYESSIDGRLLVKYSVPIKYNNEIEGILCLVKEGDNFSELIQDIDYLNTGYAIIMDSEGTIVAADKKELVENLFNPIELSEQDENYKELADVTTKIINGEQFDGSYNINGVNSFVAYANIPLTNWNVVIIAEKNDVLSTLNSLRFTLLIVIFIGLIVVLVLVLAIIVKLCSRLSILNSTINIFEKGDFNIEIPEKLLESKDEIGYIFNSINNSKEKLKTTISEVKNNSIIIKDEIESLSNTYENINSSNRMIADSVKELADGNSVQASELVDINRIVADFNKKLEEVLSSIDDIDYKSKNINDKAVVSSNDMKEITISINNFNNVFKEFICSINSLDSRIDSIKQITATINEISEQTSLLALNAAIEASRAGEAGRGFAIVADEITQLASQTKSSSEEIERMLSSILSESKKIKESSEEMTSEIKNQEVTVFNSIKSFEDIIILIEDIIPKVNEISSVSLRIEEDKNEIIRKLENSTAISEEISASSQEISITAENLSQSSENISKTISEISDVTNIVEDLVKYFSV